MQIENCVKLIMQNTRKIKRKHNCVLIFFAEFILILIAPKFVSLVILMSDMQTKKKKE